MYQIVEAMKSHNLELALNWASTKKEQLIRSESDIELKFQRLQFVEILQNNDKDEALKYDRTCFAPYASSNMAAIQKLMACFLWVGRLDSSPYSELLFPKQWDKLSEVLTRHFCNIIGCSE
ncbi:unnamed protein product [Fraxinus pennsylvanica]|uniref:CTLH domain-containing protein n=1 Tax=Fraxinus pennsylvanica TaxID=56036 RepID=A0AAD2DUP3_9LAMI|nr:unnamed protein product [Fraxinus pennsylvanica]